MLCTTFSFGLYTQPPSWVRYPKGKILTYRMVSAVSTFASVELEDKIMVWYLISFGKFSNIHCLSAIN